MTGVQTCALPILTLIDHIGGNIYNVYRNLIELNDKGEDYCGVSQEETNNVQSCLKFNGDKKRMRKLLTQIAEKGFAPLSNLKDPEAEVISQNNVGGLVHRDQVTVIGLPDHVWGENTIGVVASKQSIRLIIARVLHMNPELIADSAKADSTCAAYDLKKYSAIDEQLKGLATKIDKVEYYIEASLDPHERKLLMKKEELLREEKLILLRRQDGSII